MNRAIAFLHIFGIILIVTFHALYNGYWPHLYNWIYCFCLAIMFYASGWLLCHGQERRGQTAADISLNPIDGFWLKKYKRLLVPYLVLNTLIYVPKGLLSQFVMRPLEISWSEYIYCILHPTESPNCEFWFMPALLMLFYVFVSLAKVVKHIPERMLPYGAVLGGILAVLLYQAIGDDTLGRVFYYLIFFTAGYVSRSKRVLLQPFRYDGAVFCVAFALSLTGIYADVEYTWLFLVHTSCGALMAMALASIYMRKGWRCIDHLFGSSMTIYLYHWFVQGTIWAAYRCCGLEGEPYEFAHRFAAVVLGIYIPLLLYRMMNKYRGNRLVRILRTISGMPA